MDNHIWIHFPKNVSSVYVYNELAPRMFEFWKNKEYLEDDLYFDWGGVSHISPQVIPNLLILGHQLRMLTEKRIKIYIPTDEELLSYLDEIDFLRFARRFTVYEFYEEYIGGYVPKRSNNRKSYYIASKTTDAQIWEQLSESGSVIKRAYSDKYEFSEGFVSNNVKLALWEVCKNSVFHANSFVFLTIQKTRAIRTVVISLSDTGCGMYDSMYRRIVREQGIAQDAQLHFMSNGRFAGLRYRADRELYAIVEAVFYRWKEQVNYSNMLDEADFKCSNGLWYVVNETLRKNGTVRIHSNNYRLVLTNHLLNDVIGYSEIERLYNRNPNADNEFDDERFIKLVGRIKKSDNAQQFRYRYQGVHIEIELNI
jgi:hypothetical protein